MLSVSKGLSDPKCIKAHLPDLMGLANFDTIFSQSADPIVRSCDQLADWHKFCNHQHRICDPM